MTNLLNKYKILKKLNLFGHRNWSKRKKQIKNKIYKLEILFKSYQSPHCVVLIGIKTF